MNKNVLIGVLAAALILILGYGAFKDEFRTPLIVEDALNNIANQSSSTTGVPSQSTNQQPAGTISNIPRPTSPNPAAPTVVTSTEVMVSNSTAFVSGKVTPNGVPTSYWYEYGLTASLGVKTAKQSLGSGYSAITSPAYITGLRADTMYYFRLNAENAYGTARGTIYSFKTNSNPPVQGKAPSVETGGAVNIARTSVNLNGEIDPNDLNTEWWFEFGETTALGDVTNTGTIGAAANRTSVSAIIYDLKPLTKYYYRVNAHNQFGTVNGGIRTFTTTGPAAFTNPLVTTNTAVNITGTSATLNGRLDPKGGDTTYWFEYSTDSRFDRVAGFVTSNQFMAGGEAAIGVKADISGLARGTRYYYRLVARNQYGTSEGNVATFRTK